MLMIILSVGVAILAIAAFILIKILMDPNTYM